jgi:hypothetical protein
MTVNPQWQVQEEMEVVGSDMDKVGSVKEVRANDFLVNRHMKRDVYVPYTAIRDVSGNQVVLNIPASQVDSMGWPNPSII